MRWTNEHLAGMLPLFLNEHDPADAKTQLHNAYSHGGGWRPFEGFTLEQAWGRYQLAYAGDPPMKEVARTKLRDEEIVLFMSDWVAIIQPDRSYEIARMD